MLAKLIVIAIVLLFLWLIFFHESVPRIGRRTGRRLRDVADAGKEIIDGEEVPGSPLSRYEFQVGRTITARVLAENPLSNDASMQHRVLEIGRRLVESSGRKEIRYRFAVLEADEPQAMAIPGGSIFLTRGMVELCGANDDHLAAIIGHEVGHIECRHAAKQLATRALAKTGMRILTLGRGALVARLAGGVDGYLQQGYSHDRELEADRASRTLCARAGFRRDALSSLLRELRQTRPICGGVPLEETAYFRAHPPLGERLEGLAG